MKHYIDFRILCLIFLILSTSCKTTDGTSESLITSTATFELELGKVTVTSYPTIKNTPSPSSSPTITPSLPVWTPTYIVTQPSSTWTPFPTKNPTESVLFAENLLTFNKSCRLPCWWGILPGKTPWIEARHILEQFAEVEYYEPPDKAIAGAFITFHVSEEWQFSAISHVYYVRNSIVESIKINLPWHEELSMYRLMSFLETYGAPEQVWISTYQNVGEYGLPFFVVLDYSKMGFLAVFPLTTTFVSSNHAVGCGNDGMATPIGLWDAQLGWTFDDAAKWFQLEFGPFLSLKQASGMDIETFYNNFTKNDNEACMRTPTNLWPEQ